MTGYRRDIERWIIEAYQVGARDFWHLVSLLPGVYPTEVRQVVTTLVAASRVPERLAIEATPLVSEVGSSSEVPGLPTANPLASDWRFTSGTARKLLERIVAATGPTHKVALLGAPSVYRLAGMEQGTKTNRLD